ncbi:MAG: TGS domain-containing protein, partial [Fusobacterium sp.]
MKAILPSGDVKEFEGEVNLFTIAKSISNSLAKKSVAAKVNDELVDMSTVIDGEARVEFITPETEEGEEVIRHSTAHLMAQAVVRLFPGTKVAIGPAIENGFYYDFDPKVQFTEEDLAKIEAEMKKIVKENEKIERIM